MALLQRTLTPFKSWTPNGQASAYSQSAPSGLLSHGSVPMSSWSQFDPRSQYGGTYKPGAFATSPAGTQYFNQNPEAWWTQQTAPYSSGLTPFDKFVQSRKANWVNGYDAALGTNPNLTVPQYGAQSPLSANYFRGLFSNLAPSQRGESSSAYGGGRMRWLAG